MRFVPVGVLALALLVVGLPTAEASQAQLDRARQQANAAAAAYNAAQTRLSNLQAQVARLEAQRQAVEQQLEGLQDAVRAVAVDQYVRGRQTRPAGNLDLDASRNVRADALVHFVTAGSADTVDRYKTTATELAEASARVAAGRKDATEAVAAMRKRAADAVAQLNKLKQFEAERVAREKAKRAAAGRRVTGVLGSGAWICPVQGPRSFSDDFGAPRGGGRRRHQGNDILSPRGTPVVAPVPGAARHHDNALGGLAFYLVGSDGITYYGAHLDSYTGNVGQVAAGTVLGYVGNSGDARGGPPHLHFEMHPGGGGAVDPYATLRRYC